MPHLNGKVERPHRVDEQDRFDTFLEQQEERPHQALGMKVPADLYSAITACVSWA